VAGALTAILTGTAYAASAELAGVLKPFAGFAPSRDSMLRVIRMHRAAVDRIRPEHCPLELIEAASASWNEALELGQRNGYRNSQVSVLAPTGTIGFMMDCDTTGVEPDIALVKYKVLAGGGMFKIVNRTVPLALERLGYGPDQIREIIDAIETTDTIEAAPHVRSEHLDVFDCAFKPSEGTRSIHYMGHIRMMGAVQPFLSGAISKTVNVPKDTTIDEILNVYVDGWKMGLKAVAIYRDGSKRSQPLNLKKKQDADVAESPEERIAKELEAAKRTPHRHRLPATRHSITHKFDVAGHEGYLNVGLYEDGAPGELFITMAKEGSTVGGMMDAFATSISLCLQYGVPLEALVKKFTHQRFEPAGMTSNRDIPFAKSIVDYIFRWMGMTFLEDYRRENMPKRKAGKSLKSAPEADKEGKASENKAEKGSGKEAGNPLGARGGLYASQSPTGGNGSKSGKATSAAREAETVAQALDDQFSRFQEDAPACDNCGSITVRNGNCYKCYNCGSSLGCS
jgi:ribonucleoside-diphosphate reductase alpha chain